MSGSVLLDTNIVIGLLGKDEAILSHVVETEAVFLPSIVLGELYYGAFKSAHPEQNTQAIDRPSVLSQQASSTNAKAFVICWKSYPRRFLFESRECVR